VPEIKYCGLFTPCKNCNIETRSRDYATVDEAVFSPCRAESRSYKDLDNARVGKGNLTASAVTQQLKRFPHVRSRIYTSSQEELSVSSYEFSIGDNRGWFVVKEDSV
jgi:hypothetical protein